MRFLLLLGMLACWCGSAVAQDHFPEPTYRLNPVTVEDLKEALQLYKDFKLPLPAVNATPYGGVDYGGFRFSDNGKAWMLSGTRLEQLAETDDATLTWQGLAKMEVMPFYFRRSGFSVHWACAASVQSFYLGKTQVALHLANSLHGYAEGMIGEHDFIGRLAQPTLQAGIAMAAAAHYTNLLADPKIERSVVLDALQRVQRTRLVRQPRWKLWTGLDGLVEGLERIRTRRSPAGSVGALIDALVDSKNPPRDWLGSAPELKSLGARALPALVDSLDDPRPTRVLVERMHNGPPHLVMISDCARTLVDGLDDGWLGDGHFTKQQAADWLEASHRGRPEDYLFKHLTELVEDYWSDKKQVEISACWQTFKVMAKKRPDLLRTSFQRVLEIRPPISVSSAANAIEQSAIPVTAKIDLLRLGAASPIPKHQNEVLRLLGGLDHSLLNSLLLARLAKVPATTEGRFADSPDVNLVAEALKTADPSVWKATVQALRRVEMPMRYLMIGRLTWHEPDPEKAKQAVRALGHFFDDPGIPNFESTDEKYNHFKMNIPYPYSVGQVAILVSYELLGGKRDSDAEIFNWKELRDWIGTKLAS